MSSDLNGVTVRLREARAAKRMTRGELAAALGLSESTVRAHENGQNGLKAEPAAAYAAALDVTPQWLLYGDGSGPLMPAPAPPMPAAAVPTVSLTQTTSGMAWLEIRKTVPFSVALKVLALIEESAA